LQTWGFLKVSLGFLAAPGIPMQWENTQQKCASIGKPPVTAVVTLRVTNAAPFDFPIPHIFVLFPAHLPVNLLPAAAFRGDCSFP